MAKAKRDIYQEVTDLVIKAIEEGTQPWSRPWACGKGMALALRHDGKPYRGINQFLLGMYQMQAGFNSPYWMTYNQAKKLGGQVRKGERGSMSVFFKMLDVPSKAPDAKKGDKDRIPLLRHNMIFNAAQIEGLPDRFYIQPAEINQDELIADADEFFSKTGCPVRHGGNSAHLSLNTGIVHMPEFAAFKTANDYYATLAHETIHWVGLKRDEIEPDLFGSVNYAKEELVAEMGAAFTMAHLGLSSEPRPDHASYIASWLKKLKEDKKFIFQASSKAQARVDDLIARVEPATETEAA